MSLFDDILAYGPLDGRNWLEGLDVRIRPAEDIYNAGISSPDYPFVRNGEIAYRSAIATQALVNWTFNPATGATLNKEDKQLLVEYAARAGALRWWAVQVSNGPITNEEAEAEYSRAIEIWLEKAFVYLFDNPIYEPVEIAPAKNVKAEVGPAETTPREVAPNPNTSKGAMIAIAAILMLIAGSIAGRKN